MECETATWAWDSPETNQKALTQHAHGTIGMYLLGQLLIFFPYLLYFGRVGYSNMALRAPLSCMHLSICTPGSRRFALTEIR